MFKDECKKNDYFHHQLRIWKAKAVYGIEIVEEAVESANKSAKENGLTNCTFIAGDVLEEI